MNKKIPLIAMLSIAHIHTMDVPSNNEDKEAFLSENLNPITKHGLPITTQTIQKVIKYEYYLFFLLDDHTIKAYNLATKKSFDTNIQVLLSFFETGFFLKPKIKHISDIFTTDETLYMPVATDDKVFLAKVRLPDDDNNVITLDINKKIITHNTSICSLHTVMTQTKKKNNAIFVISSSHYPSIKIWQHELDNKNLNNHPLNCPGALYSGIESDTTANTKMLFFFKDTLNQEPLTRWLKRNDETFNAKMIFMNSNDIIQFNKNNNSEKETYFSSSFSNNDQIVEKKTQTFSQCFLQENVLTEKNKLYGGWCDKKNNYILLFYNNLNYSNKTSQTPYISSLSNSTDLLQKNHPKKILFFYNTKFETQDDTIYKNELYMIALFENKLMAYKLSIKDTNNPTILYGHQITKLDVDTYETMLFDEVKKTVYCICKKKNTGKKILYSIPINALEYVAEYPSEKPFLDTYENIKEFPYLERIDLFNTKNFHMKQDKDTNYTIEIPKNNIFKPDSINYSDFKLTERTQSKKIGKNTTLDNEVFIFDNVDENIRITVNVSKNQKVATCTIDYINTRAEPNKSHSKKTKK